MAYLKRKLAEWYYGTARLQNPNALDPRASGDDPEDEGDSSEAGQFLPAFQCRTKPSAVSAESKRTKAQALCREVSGRNVC